MKKFILFTVVAILLTSCSSQKQISEDTEKDKVLERNYDEISAYNIKWIDIHSINDNHYFIYIYSLTCMYCNQYKNEIISKRIDEKMPIFYCEFSNDILLCDRFHFSEKKDSCILGTPSMIEYLDKKVVINVAGISSIKSLLESYDSN